VLHAIPGMHRRGDIILGAVVSLSQFGPMLYMRLLSAAERFISTRIGSVSPSAIFFELCAFSALRRQRHGKVHLAERTWWPPLVDGVACARHSVERILDRFERRVGRRRLGPLARHVRPHGIGHIDGIIVTVAKQIVIASVEPLRLPKLWPTNFLEFLGHLHEVGTYWTV